jgi:hypothetical protein
MFTFETILKYEFMNRTRKNIAISVIPIHQFFFIRNRFCVEVVVTGAGCDVGADSG